jgi:hypothetical protein
MQFRLILVVACVVVSEAVLHSSKLKAAMALTNLNEKRRDLAPIAQQALLTLAQVANRQSSTPKSAADESNMPNADTITSLAAVASSLTTLAKQDPGAARATVQTIMVFVQQLEAGIVKQHNQSQDLVDSNLALFSDCHSQLPTGMRAVIEKYNCSETCCSDYTSTCMACSNCTTETDYCGQYGSTPGCGATYYPACYDELNALQVLLASCTREANALNTAKVAVCGRYSDANTPTPPYESFCSGTTVTGAIVSGTYGDYLLTRVNLYYALKQRRDDCDNSTAVYDAQQEVCGNISQNVTIKLEQCSNLTATTTGSPGISKACMLYTEKATVCSVYASCYTNANTAFQNSLTSAQRIETSLKQEWTALQHIDCLLEVLLSNSTDRDSELQACQTQSVNTDFLTIQVPSVPDEAACDKGAQPANCQLATTF